MTAMTIAMNPLPIAIAVEVGVCSLGSFALKVVRDVVMVRWVNNAMFFAMVLAFFAFFAP